jgi:hypothetical protein
LFWTICQFHCVSVCLLRARGCQVIYVRYKVLGRAPGDLLTVSRCLFKNLPSSSSPLPSILFLSVCRPFLSIFFLLLVHGIFRQIIARSPASSVACIQPALAICIKGWNFLFERLAKLCQSMLKAVRSSGRSTSADWRGLWTRVCVYA